MSALFNLLKTCQPSSVANDIEGTNPPGPEHNNPLHASLLKLSEITLEFEEMSILQRNRIEERLDSKITDFIKQLFSDTQSVNLPIAVILESKQNSSTLFLSLCYLLERNEFTSQKSQFQETLLEMIPIELSVGYQSVLNDIAANNILIATILNLNNAFLHGDTNNVNTILLNAANAQPTSSFATIYLRHLERSDSFESLNDWYMNHRHLLYFQFLRELTQQYELGRLENFRFAQYLRQLIPYGKGDIDFHVRIWEGMFRAEPFETEDLANYYRNYPPISGEFGSRSLLKYEENDVPNPQSSIEIENSRKSVSWLLDREVDVRILEAVGGVSSQLFGEPCRLSQLRILNFGMSHYGESTSAVISEFRKQGENWCPIHITAIHDAESFLNQFVPKNRPDFGLTRKGTNLFHNLARASQEFDLNEEQTNFLARGSQSLLAWQERALLSWAAHGRKGVVSAATGTGKSRVGVAAILESINERPVVLLSHRLAIKGQWKKDELAAIPGAIDIYGNQLPNAEMYFQLGSNVLELSSEDKFDFGAPPKAVKGKVLLALDKSLAARPHLMPRQYEESGLLVADEVHRFDGQFGNKVLEGNFDYRLGLSATINWRDMAVLGKFGKAIVADYPMSDAVRDGVISEYNLLVVRAKVERSDYVFGKSRQILALNQSQRMHHVDEQELEEVTHELSLTYTELCETLASRDIHIFEDFENQLNAIVRSRNPDLSKIVKKYLNVRSNHDRLSKRMVFADNFYDVFAPHLIEYGKTLIFSNWREYGKRIAEELSMRRVKVKYLDGDADYSQRDSAFQRLSGTHSDCIDAIVAPNILDEGINIPEARIGLFMSNCPEGYRQIVQRMGRILRKKKDGKRALIVLTVGKETREDPGTDGLRTDLPPDSMFKVMAKNASNFYVVDLDTPDLLRSRMQMLLEEQAR